MPKGLVTSFSDQHAEELEATGLTHCRLDCGKDLKEVIEGFEWLTGLSPPMQKRWQITVDESTPPALHEWIRRHGVHQGQKDLGLTRRGGVNPVTNEKEDYKWVLHVKKGFREVVNGQGGYHGNGKKFLDACERVLQSCYSLWDKALNMLGGVEREDPEGVLRLIRYDPVKTANEIVAAPHWDRNSGTIHLWESHKGLWVPEKDDYSAREPNNMRLLHRASDDEIHMLCEAKLGWNYPYRFKPIWHRGMAPEVDVPRIVVVYFHHAEFANLPEKFRSHARDPLARRIRSARSAVA